MTTDSDITQVHNYIGGKFVPPSSGAYLDVENPATLETIGKVYISTAKDVDLAVSTAKAAFPAWSSLTIKARAAMVSKKHPHPPTHRQ
jgi:acyl-CoA reductase-like NAD-dependent aldehyde dehydrogenase